MKRAMLGGLLVALGSVSARGEPVWIAWEGDDWPEAVGYTRSWGNWQGLHQGGANRTLEDGVLTYDSLYDPGVWDSYYMEDAVSLNPQDDEVFVCQWRLKVDVVDGPDDPGIGIVSDDGWALGFAFAEDHIRSIFEDYLEIPFAPYAWHEYRIVSTDMRQYALWIDGQVARLGTFGAVFPGSYVGWGEGTQGAASLHHWDYFRFGIVPEPRALAILVLAWVTVSRGARREPMACAYVRPAAGGTA